MKFPPSCLLASLAGLTPIASVRMDDLDGNTADAAISHGLVARASFAVPPISEERPALSLSSPGSDKVESEVDTGILNAPLFSSRRGGRLLQSSSSSSQSNCPSTCSADLCSCVSQYGYAEPCSQQLNDVCIGSALSPTGTSVSISDCVIEDYVYYYQKVYCPFAACRVGGGSYEKCQCDSYVDFCNIYQGKEGYEKDAKTLKYCSIAICCQGNFDDAGRAVCLAASFQNAEDMPTPSPVDDDGSAQEEDLTSSGRQDGALTSVGGQNGGAITSDSPASSLQSDSSESSGLGGADAAAEDADRDAPATNSAYPLLGNSSRISSAMPVVIGACVWLMIWG
ncbi:hypothetical protein HJC23_005466 [Cyclotella cryptica]|uniref:Uncharacterized protein n=1 Tax=Cyclotella cryptica TaxID=29204 RepID=A0ABD3PJC7_9STRA|eukprot:CCRYP_013946-RA/>CCRYP_013946-RA protein AED:0.18 eAED:0.18 QI:0/-1/0/1/-1/1/1/0/338